MKCDHLHPLAIASVIPALVPLGGIWPVLVIGLIAYLQYSFFRHRVHLHRELIFSTYLADESPLMGLRPYTFFVKVIAVALSISFSIFTFLGMFAAGWSGCLAILAGALGGTAMGEHLSNQVLSHARVNVRAYYSLKWTFGLAVVFAVVAFIIVDLLSSFGDYGSWDAAKTASTIVESTKHGSKWVQDVARTIDYIHYTKLRLRDTIPFGWVIYIFMVIPNVFPICGAVAAMFGTTRIFNLSQLKDAQKV